MISREFKGVSGKGDDIIRNEIATTMCKSLNGLVPELSNLFRKKSTR